MATFEEDVHAALGEIQSTYAKTSTFVADGSDVPLEDVVIGKRTFRYIDEFGFTVHKETRDFIFSADQLSGIEPKVGNAIKQTYGGFVHTFKIVSPNNEPCFHFSDDSNNTIRIHTLFASKVAE